MTARSTMRYRTIVADPPWDIAWNGATSIRMGGGGRKLRPSTIHAMPYQTMTLDAICAIDVASLAAPDSLLFMWATRKVFREGDAAKVARAWGFKPCGEVIWGLRNPGLGGAIGNDHEPILIARRGTATIDHVSPVGVAFWRQPYSSTGKIHSAKPDGFMDFVEQVSPGPYLEMFARRARFGWDYWGDESLSTVEGK